MNKTCENWCDRQWIDRTIFGFNHIIRSWEIGRKQKCFAKIQKLIHISHFDEVQLFAKACVCPLFFQIISLFQISR